MARPESDPEHGPIPKSGVIDQLLILSRLEDKTEIVSALVNFRDQLTFIGDSQADTFTLGQIAKQLGRTVQSIYFKISQLENIELNEEYPLRPLEAAQVRGQKILRATTVYPREVLWTIALLELKSSTDNKLVNLVQSWWAEMRELDELESWKSATDIHEETGEERTRVRSAIANLARMGRQLECLPVSGGRSPYSIYPPHAVDAILKEMEAMEARAENMSNYVDSRVRAEVGDILSFRTKGVDELPIPIAHDLNHESLHYQAARLRTILTVRFNVDSLVARARRIGCDPEVLALSLGIGFPVAECLARLIEVENLIELNEVDESKRWRKEIRDKFSGKANRR